MKEDIYEITKSASTRHKKHIYLTREKIKLVFETLKKEKLITGFCYPIKIMKTPKKSHKNRAFYNEGFE